MTLRARFLLYFVLLHLGFASIAIVVLIEKPIWLVVVEGLFLVSIFIAVKLTRAFLVPLELIRTGAELIRERDFSSHFRPVGQPEMDALIAVYNRMIDQLRQERLRLRERNELFDQIVHASPGGIVILDLEGRVDQLNPSAANLLGADVAGRRLDAIETPLAAALSALEPGTSRVLALPDGRRLRGQRAEFRDHGFARTFYLLEELTEELRQSEKAAYEKLIRMMSHEVNNSVAAVGSLIGSLDHTAGRLDQDDRADFEQALRISSERLDHLRSFMNGFADVVRLPEPDRRPCDLRVLLTDMAELMTPYLEDRRIRLVSELDGHPSPVPLDKNQIEQVLVNLIKNAAEAIQDDGTVILRLGNDSGVPWIEIEDDGGGISEDVRAQLFTPFFTTKDDGCGLGLTVVKEILGRHGFGISLMNRPGEATRFRVLMPNPGQSA